MELLLNYGMYVVVAIVILLAVFQRKTLQGLCKAISLRISDFLFTPENRLLAKKAEVKDSITALNENIKGLERSNMNYEANIRTNTVSLNALLKKIESTTDEVMLKSLKQRALTIKQMIDRANQNIASNKNAITRQEQLRMMLETHLLTVDQALNELKNNVSVNMVEIKQILTGKDQELNEIINGVEHNRLITDIASESTQDAILKTTNIDDEFDAMFGKKEA